MFLALKVVVTALLVAAVSLAARYWGPAIGGLLMGLPWMTGPVLFFLALEQGEGWAAEACIGVELGVVAIAAYTLTYCLTARHASWPVSVVAASAAYAVVGVVIRQFDPSLIAAAAAGTAALFAAYLAIPAPTTDEGPQPLPWWDIPARMLATAVLVAVISVSVDYLGPRWSGIVSTFPVITTVIAAFTHNQWGLAPLTRIVRALLMSLQSFVVFFLVLGLALEPMGVAAAHVLAAAGALVVSALLMFGSRRARS